MTQTNNESHLDARHSMKLVLMRKQAIAWMMYDEDLKKKMLSKKKKSQAKVRTMESWRYKNPMSIAG